MPNIRAFSLLAALAIAPLAAACSTSTEAATTDTAVTAETVSVDSATSSATAAELVALIQSAYGEAGLGLHRGHQPVEDVLDEVLGISHDELHARMDSGQNLATIAEDLGIDPQTLIDAMVESWRSPIDDAVAAGEITSDEAAAYLDALTEAFTFKVTWNGSDATPTFTGI